MQFDPKTENYGNKVAESFKKQAFMKTLGAKLVEVRPGFCEIHVPFSKALTQQNGYFHAGVIATIADNTAGYAAFSLMEAHSDILTVEFKLNFLSPGKGEMLIGRGEVIKSGKTLTICRSELYVKQGEEEKLCAAGQSTLIQIRNST
ncbi:MAG: PaaI family thioesterase [Bacteroidia bacterium]|nr:PaaI family thioesterase [Bacteroidia bacterium]NNM23860.1 PaaI family thioesterase [Flavobacteriaceae bacterium]